MDNNGRSPNPRLDPGTLLRVSDHFLRRRHYDDCRKYAQQAHQINPNFSGVSEIIAIADVLLAAKTLISAGGDLIDWYAVLQLNRYSDDADLIRQRFSHLYGLLDPSVNTFSLAKEAFDTVCDAWYVLSNPLQKSEFDDLLRKHFGDEKPKSKCDLGIWTVCPYCYYLYEFPRVYLDACLRCPNEKCSKAFTCLEVDRPPAEVLMDGKYFCAGFLPAVGVRDGGWNPFAPLKNEKTNVSANASDEYDGDNVVEISDDDDDDDKSLSGSVKMDGGNGMGGVKPAAAMGRKKSVAKKTKKVTGVGNRVTKEGFLVNREEAETGVEVVRCNDNDHVGYENEFSFGDVEIDPMNDGGDVEFYDADGDILVSLQQNGI